jgi:hypothetical protein
MSIYVFLGPTLPVAEARRLLKATYLPPIAMGDVAALMLREPETPTAIAIIDGVFERVPAVWHKEILFALSQGVRVFGSSSMGALRAAELHTFGMEGVGRVFEAYRDGLLEDDDEVAITHAPATFGYRQLSEALVNIRDGLTRAQAHGLIAPATQQALLHAAKRLFYPQRSWPNVFAQGTALGLPPAELAALKDFVRRAAPNVKRDDARALLRRMAQECAAGMSPHVPHFTFEPTCFWLKLAALQDSMDAPEDGSEGAEATDERVTRQPVMAE